MWRCTNVIFPTYIDRNPGNRYAHGYQRYRRYSGDISKIQWKEHKVGPSWIYWYEPTSTDSGLNIVAWGVKRALTVSSVDWLAETWTNSGLHLKRLKGQNCPGILWRKGSKELGRVDVKKGFIMEDLLTHPRRIWSIYLSWPWEINLWGKPQDPCRALWCSSL